MINQIYYENSKYCQKCARTEVWLAWCIVTGQVPGWESISMLYNNLIQNHRMVEIGRELWGHLVQHLLRQGSHSRHSQQMMVTFPSILISYRYIQQHCSFPTSL